MNSAADLGRDGYAVLRGVLDERTLRAIERCLAGFDASRAGTRNLLRAAWCRALGQRLVDMPALAHLIPPRAAAVQCTLFDKSPDCNWSVPLHRDVHIPVAQRVDHPGLSGWSRKEGSWFVRAPLAVLRQMLALRLQIDDGVADGGGLCVVSGSHAMTLEPPSAGPIVRECAVGRGGVFAMRPLLLHASAKATLPVRRRVLHFLFAPCELPFGLRWATAA